MRSSMGNQFKITIFGESHGTHVGAVIDGIPAGLRIDIGRLKQQMGKRNPSNSLGTDRHEKDLVEFISGVFNGVTTGAPCCLLIKNEEQKSSDYEEIKAIIRPSHADFGASQRFNGFNDYRGGGHFSGRLTAPLVAAGFIALELLGQKGIQVGTHITKIHEVEDGLFSSDLEELRKQISQLKEQRIQVLNPKKQKEMELLIAHAKEQQNSVGGILETAVINLPVGVGEPFFHSLESQLSQGLFSIGGIKGVEFGLGFGFANYYGSQVNDEFYMNEEKIKTKTNHNGGVLGGLSTGMPLLINSVMKPTSSIGQKQESVNIKTMKNTTLEIQGRHDPAIVYRVPVVVDSVVALVLVDCLMMWQGQQYFQGEME